MKYFLHSTWALWAHLIFTNKGRENCTWLQTHGGAGSHLLGRKKEGAEGSLYFSTISHFLSLLSSPSFVFSARNPWNLVSRSLVESRLRLILQWPNYLTRSSHFTNHHSNTTKDPTFHPFLFFQGAAGIQSEGFLSFFLPPIVPSFFRFYLPPVWNCNGGASSWLGNNSTALLLCVVSLTLIFITLQLILTKANLPFIAPWRKPNLVRRKANKITTKETNLYGQGRRASRNSLPLCLLFRFFISFPEFVSLGPFEWEMGRVRITGYFMTFPIIIPPAPAFLYTPSHFHIKKTHPLNRKVHGGIWWWREEGLQVMSFWDARPQPWQRENKVFSSLSHLPGSPLYHHHYHFNPFYCQNN